MSIVLAQRASARRDRMDAHHGSANAHSRGLCLVDALEGSVEARHIRRGPTHVEADRAREAHLPGDVCVGHHAPGRAREDRVGPSETRRIGQPAARLHDAQGRAGQLREQGAHVVPDEWCQIGIHTGRVPTRDDPDLCRNLVRERDVLETHLPRDLAQLPLELARAVRVQQHNRDAAQPPLSQRAQLPPYPVWLRSLDHTALGVGPGRHLEHLLIEQLRLADLQLEDAGTRLRADLEQIPEALRDHQRAGRTPPLEQSVGRDGRAHAHVASRNRIRVCQAEDASNSVQWSPVGREQLHHPHIATSRVAPQAVGEGAAAVDPELPASVRTHARKLAHGTELRYR